MKKRRARQIIEKDNYHDYIFCDCAFYLNSLGNVSKHEDVKRIADSLEECSEIISRTEHKLIASYNELVMLPANKKDTPVYKALRDFEFSLIESEKLDRQVFKKTFALVQPVTRMYRQRRGADLNHPVLERTGPTMPKVSNDKGLVNSFKRYYQIVSAIVTDINEMSGWKRINRYFRERIKPASIESINKPLTFLSFAFKDNIYALFLYNYFEKNGGFLYVDSLFGKDYGDDGAAIKGALSPWIDASSQILFLHSINSDKVTKGLSSWCSWELGEAYRSNTSDAPKKFYKVVVAGIIDSHAIIDDTFKELDYVANGIIHPKIFYR